MNKFKLTNVKDNYYLSAFRTVTNVAAIGWGVMAGYLILNCSGTYWSEYGSYTETNYLMVILAVICVIIAAVQKIFASVLIEFFDNVNAIRRYCEINTSDTEKVEIKAEAESNQTNN